MKFAIVFVILGALVSYLALSAGQLAVPVLWFAFSCFALAAGYAGLGPRIFGKRPDGTIPFAMKVLHLPYLVLSETVWQLAVALGRENPVDRLSDDLALGRRLRAREVPDGMVNYVDLTSECEDPREVRERPGYLLLPILDASVPAMEALESVLTRLRPGPTFVHCAQGHGRTGLFALALLAHQQRIRSFEEGLEMLRRVRPGVGLNDAQERFVRTFIAAKCGATGAPAPSADRTQAELSAGHR